MLKTLLLELCSWRENGGLEGYGNDMEPQQTGINWNDRLHLQVHPEQHRKLQHWPQNPPNFSRKTLEEYSIKTTAVLEGLLKAVARSLKLEENRFSELWQKKIQSMRGLTFIHDAQTQTRLLGSNPMEMELSSPFCWKTRRLKPSESSIITNGLGFLSSQKP